MTRPSLGPRAISLATPQGPRLNKALGRRPPLAGRCRLHHHQGCRPRGPYLICRPLTLLWQAVSTLPAEPLPLQMVLTGLPPHKAPLYDYHRTSATRCTRVDAAVSTASVQLASNSRHTPQPWVTLRRRGCKRWRPPSCPEDGMLMLGAGIGTGAALSTCCHPLATDVPPFRNSGGHPRSGMQRGVSQPSLLAFTCSRQRWQCNSRSGLTLVAASGRCFGLIVASAASLLVRRRSQHQRRLTAAESVGSGWGSQASRRSQPCRKTATEAGAPFAPLLLCPPRRRPLLRHMALQMRCLSISGGALRVSLPHPNTCG